MGVRVRVIMMEWLATFYDVPALVSLRELHGSTLYNWLRYYILGAVGYTFFDISSNLLMFVVNLLLSNRYTFSIINGEKVKMYDIDALHIHIYRMFFYVS